MKRILLDVNVVLDVLLDRAPHAEASGLLWAMAERGEVEGVVPAHGVTTIHYVARRYRDQELAATVVDDLLQVFDVAAVSAEVLRLAARRAWPDFEDAVCAESAVAARCDLLVTRDGDGFPSPPLPVLDPLEALSVLWVVRAP